VHESLINGYVFGLIKKVNVSVQPHPNFCGRNHGINGIPKWSVKESKHAYRDAVPHQTLAGTISRNKMDTHADTCCGGGNWKLLDSTNEVCEITPFLDSYELVKEVMVIWCSAVWTSPNTGHENLLVSDQMLWFGSQMDHSLINPNQIHDYRLPVYDNPFANLQFGININKPPFPSIPGGLLFTLIPMC
jgi:hypothetical protein